MMPPPTSLPRKAGLSAAEARSAGAPSLPVALPEARLRLLKALGLVPALLYLATVLAPPLNHDVAALLNFTERWIAGERLYTDLIDVNPPLIFLLTLLPAGIAAWTPLDGVQALLLCMVLFCGLCWRLTTALRRGRAEGAVEAAVLFALVPFLLVAAGYDFGQREHLMAISAIPYAMLAARRVEGPPVGRGLTFVVTLVAALAFALKPHFLAVPALVELLVLIRVGFGRALKDPVPWTMAATWVVYVASIPVLFPDYFGYVVPLVWDYYVDLGVFSWVDVLISDLMGPAVLALLMVLPIALHPRAGAFAQALAAAAIGAFLSAWVQHKGWSYHVMPVLVLSIAAVAAAGSRWLDRALPAARARAAAPALAAVAAFGALAYMARGGEAPWRQLWFDWDKVGRITAWLKREAYGERLLVLSPDIFPVYPALNYARAQSTLRTMNSWLLQGVYNRCPANGARYRETWEMSRAEFFVYRTVAEDFSRAPPSAVLVSSNPGIPWCGKEFDFIEYFSRHPLFAATWQRYRQTGEIQGYRLFVRED